jgi:hypothetical protein
MNDRRCGERVDLIGPLRCHVTDVGDERDRNKHEESDAAVALARAGVEVARGDLLVRPSLVRVFTGAYGVFGVTQPWSPDYRTSDVAAEIRHKRLALRRELPVFRDDLVWSLGRHGSRL